MEHESEEVKCGREVGVVAKEASNQRFCLLRRACLELLVRSSQHGMKGSSFCIHRRRAYAGAETRDSPSFDAPQMTRPHRMSMLRAVFVSASRAFLAEGVRLASAELAETTFAWFARWLSVGLTLVYAVLAAQGQLRNVGEPGATWIAAATRTSVWLVAGAVVLASAQQRAMGDRKSGFEWVLRGAGASRRGVVLVQGLATFSLAVRYTLLAVAAVGVVCVALSPSLGVAVSRALVLAACVVFAIVMPAMFSVLAVTADLASPSRGRSVLYLLGFLSVALAELVSVEQLSVFHWMSDLLPMLTRAFGVLEPR